MSRSRIAASFFLLFIVLSPSASAQTTAVSKACKAGYTYMIVPTATGVSVREAQRVDCTAKDASGALVNRDTRECSQNIGDIYWDCRKGLTEGSYKCEHKTCKHGEAISNPATNSSPSPLTPSSQMQLPDVIVQETGSTPLPPLSRQSILDALQDAPSNTGQDTVYRSPAADSFEKFMLEAGLAPGGLVPGTGHLDAGTPLSQTPNAADAARLQGGIISDIPATRVPTSQEERGAGGPNTFAPSQVAQFSAERPVTWEDRISTFLGCTVGYFFGGCDSATAQTEKTDAQVIAEAGRGAQPDITILAVTPNVTGGKDTQLTEADIQSRIAKDLTPGFDQLPPASQAIATKNAADQYNRLTPESQATVRSMAIQGIQFDRAMAQSKNSAAQSQSPAAPPLPSPLDAAVAAGKSVAVTTAKSVWDWGRGSVRSWFGSADTSVAPTEGEQPNPPAAVQAPNEPSAPVPATPSVADIDVMTRAQLKEVEARLSADKSAQLAEDEARRTAAIPKSPQTLQNNIFAGLYKAIGGRGTEDLQTAWNEAALARSNPEPVPITPVQVAELAPIPGVESRTASAPALAQSRPDEGTAQPAALPPPFTVDAKVDAQVRQSFEAQKQSAQSQIRYFEDLLGRSGTTVSELAAQGSLSLSQARLDAIVAEEKLYNAGSPSPALRAAVEQFQSGGAEGAWAKSFTSFAGAAHKMSAETSKEMQTVYTNPAEVIGGLADGAIVLGSGFAGGVTEGLRNFAMKAGVPGFEDDPNRALVDAIDPYKKYTQTAVDAANVVPFGYGIYSAGKMGFGAVVDMMSPARIVVRDLGVIGELSAPGMRIAGTDLVESGMGTGLPARVSSGLDALGDLAGDVNVSIASTPKSSLESLGQLPKSGTIFDDALGVAGVPKAPESLGQLPKSGTIFDTAPAAAPAKVTAGTPLTDGSTSFDVRVDSFSPSKFTVGINDVEGVRVGSAVIQTYKAENGAPAFMEAQWIGVDEGVRNSGYGRELVDKVAEIAKDSNLPVILNNRTAVDAANNPAVYGMYERHGWQAMFDEATAPDPKYRTLMIYDPAGAVDESVYRKLIDNSILTDAALPGADVRPVTVSGARLYINTDELAGTGPSSAAAQDVPRTVAQMQAVSAEVTSAGIPHASVTRVFDAGTSPIEMVRTSAVYDTLVEQGFGGIVPKEYKIDKETKLA